MTDTLLHLSEAGSYDAITCPSKAIQRGMHCPLFGYVLMTKYFRDMPFLLIGTDECGFYGREIIKVVADDPLHLPVYTYNIEEKDVIYGCSTGVLSALQEIARREKPAAICVVSTCVPELIGEDIAGVVFEAMNTLAIPVIHCVAHNFGENSHVDGMSDFMASLIGLMEPVEPRKKSVNLLCGRGEAEKEGELTRWLSENGIEILLRMPSEGSIADVQKAPAAQLNIVTDSIGIKLAQKMEAAFGIPYVLFGHYADPQRILKSYQALEQLLALPEDPALTKKAEALQSIWEEIGTLVSGKKFIYSNSPLISADAVLMLSQYGAEAIALYVISKNDFDRSLFPALSQKGIDPFVTMLTDFGISEKLLKKYKPEIFIGRMTDRVKAETNAVCLDFEDVPSGQGFEALHHCLTYLLQKLKEGK